MITTIQKSFILAAVVLVAFAHTVQSQVTETTLALQDFEITPASPTWTYSGTPNGFLEGFSAVTATPANSPLGIGGSRAWHVVTVSGGNPVTFDTMTVPPGFDRVVARFKLAAMNLNATTGGPDNLDYVLVEYSIDGGSTFVSRLRVRGAVNNNCSWAYDATAVAAVLHLPEVEEVFQPIDSGLQTEFGYSTVEIEFPGTITQLSLRITPRSSSSNDSWLIDNLELIGETDVPVELYKFEVE